MKSTIILFISFFVLIFWGCGDEPEDCAGIAGGEAFENEYGYCVGGNTGLPENFYGTITDTDGNVYNTVIIGNQVWMAENLKVTHYRNGTAIPTGHSNSEWSNLSTGAYCNYDNSSSNVSTYGRLYNWYAVNDSRNIAPEGWRVPSDAEWQTLVDYLGGSSVAGGKMKETGTTHWNRSNTGATNESGFSALPGGYRLIFGYYIDVGSRAWFWSSTEYDSSYAWFRFLSYYNSRIARLGYDGYKDYGFSVRCIRD